MPHIFPNLPAYLSTVSSTSRQNPEKRREKLSCTCDVKNLQWLKSDQIINKYNLEEFIIVPKDNLYYFVLINFSDIPKVDISFSIDFEFNVKFFAKNNLVHNRKFKFILGANLKCDLYSKLENLISFLINNNENLDSIDDRITTILSKINNSIHVEENLLKKNSLIFHHDQLKLLYSKQNRYSTDLIIFSLVFPGAYRFLRDLI